MKKHFLKIKTQLTIGFAITIVLLILLAAIAFVQTNQLFIQAETLYQHPLTVLKTLGNLREDILTTRVSFRDLMIAGKEADRQLATQTISAAEADAFLKFDLLYEFYLGPRENIDEAFKAFTTWQNAVNASFEQIKTGNIQSVEQSLAAGGTIAFYRDDMLTKIKVINDFAKNKADELYSNYVNLNKTLNVQLLLLIAASLVLTLIISNIMIRKIKKPLQELTDVTRHFHQGDLDARCTYNYMNEFGDLAASFNTMVDTIQINLQLNSNAAKLVGIMLSKEDAKEFFLSTLQFLAEHTGAQMCAVYLLSDNEKSYDRFESIGLNNQARQSFDAKSLEGELGISQVSSRNHHLIKIVDDSQMTFSAVSGDFVPHEIMTIPIQSGQKTVAIISLACISSFKKNATELIDSILATMSARIEGILAYRTIANFKDTLEQQNRELETQKNELTQQNSELEIQKRQLDEGSKLKTNFLSNMSHELRTPLNSVIALSGILNRRLAKQIPDEEYSYLEIIERNGKNLLTLINDILDIARIEAGREEIEVTNFNLNHVVADVVSLIQIQAQQKNIELISEIKGPDLHITSDATKISHILQNIIGNAVKFTEQGSIRIATKSDGSQISIAITDTGIGMNDEYLPHIFDEFRQADASTSRKYGGTGLGMAIAKKYANLLGGTITVQSKLGQGSTFTLFLPARALREPAKQDQDREFVPKPNQPQPKPDSSSDEKVILLVEDSESAIIQIKDFIQESGYRLLVAHDAAEAFKIMDQTVPDAIILDLMIPVIDGFAVLKAIRNADRTSHVPVLILTAKQITKDELKFLKHNRVHQLIQKGDVNRLELQKAIDSMLYPVLRVTANTYKERPLVLVVEDNPDNMITAKAILAEHYNVIGAFNGQEGVEMARASVPDLILMDIELPILDGIKAFTEIRKIPQLQKTPIIALTASAMIHDREAILAYGFDAFITKPIIEKQFFKVINEVLYGQ